MNAYFLEDVISSSNLVLVLVIFILMFALLSENLRRSRTEQNLQKNKNENELLQKLFLSMKTPYVVINENGVITNINEAALSIFNKSRDEMLEEIFDPFFIVKSSFIESGKLDDSVRNNKAYDFDTSIKINNEQINCVLQITGVIQDELAKYLIGIKIPDPTDTTDHENNQRDERINRLEDITDVGYFVYNHEDESTRWSRGLYKLLGATINETEPSINFITQIDAPNQDIQDIILAIQNMTPYSNKIKIVGYDDVIRWVQIDITHQEGIYGKNSTLGILKLINSVESNLDNYIMTTNELDLLDNPSFFQLVLVGNDGKIQAVNQAFADYVDLSKEEIAGKDLKTLFKDQSIKEVEQNGQKMILIDNGEDVIILKLLALNSGGGVSFYIALPLNLKPDRSSKA